MPNPKSNHFYIEKNYSDFFNNSKILNADRTEAVTKRENFLLLAALGYYCGFRTEFENSRAKASDIFVMNQLRDNELSLLYAIAIAETGDLEVVNDDLKVADIAMEFANTGIIELQKIEKSKKRNEIKRFQAYIHDVISELK